jgi:hypothetical protein
MPSPFPWNDVFPIILLTGQLSHPGPVRSTSPVISLVGGFGEQLPASGTRATPKAQGTSCCECLQYHASPLIHCTEAPKYEVRSIVSWGFPSTISAAKLVYGHEARPELSSPSSPHQSSQFSTLGATSAAPRTQLPVLITSTAPAEAPGDGCKGGVRPRAPCSKYRCYAPWAISTPLLQRLADGPQRQDGLCSPNAAVLPCLAKPCHALHALHHFRSKSEK